MATFTFTGKTFNIENATLRYRNFAGKESEYNRSGIRKFCLDIEDADLVAFMRNEGWNVKERVSNVDENAVTYYIEVIVNTTSSVAPPRVWLITSRSKRLLSVEELGDLDTAEIKCADIVINPYRWTVGSKTGIKAYLKDAYITIEEDMFAAKYDIY